MNIEADNPMGSDGTNNPLTIIEEANTKTLEYFNKTYLSNLELVQNLKTELFELEVQIETLEKTRDLYTYHVDNRRNVFSPLSDSGNSSISTYHRPPTPTAILHPQRRR